MVRSPNLRFRPLSSVGRGLYAPPRTGYNIPACDDIREGSVREKSEDAPIRRVHLRKDLGAIADLLARGFGDRLDGAGKMAIRAMQQHAQTPTLIKWLARSRFQLLSSGWVWAEDGQIIGHVTLHRERGVWVLANVAVDPDCRRRGIASALIQTALDHAAQKGGGVVHLQVDFDNVPAQNLYERFGFERKAVWVRWWHPTGQVEKIDGFGGTVRRRQPDEWRAEYEMARSMGRDEIEWLKPLTERAFHRNRWQRLRYGSLPPHWVAVGEDGALLGSAALDTELLRAFNRLYLWTGRDCTLQAVAALVPAALLGAAQRRPVLLDHPSQGAEEEALAFCGFEVQRMQYHMLKKL